MLDVLNERYKLIGEISIALYTKKIKISFDSLKAIMKDHGFEYSEEGNRGLARAVAAAYNAWEKIDPVVHHAIAHTICNQYGNPAWLRK